MLDRLDARLRLKDISQALTELLVSLATWGVLPEAKIGLEACVSASQVRNLASESMFLESLLSWCAGPAADPDHALSPQSICHSAIEQHESTGDVNNTYPTPTNLTASSEPSDS